MYRTLQIDTLEARALPSATMSAIPTAHAQVQHATAQPHSISGEASGHYSTSAPVSGSGSVFSFSGAGKVAGLGHVQVMGSVTAVGAGRGHAQGVITISSSTGSYMIEVTGPQQRAFAMLPTNFHYHVLQSTGVVQGFSGGHGSLTLNLVGGSMQSRFQMLFH